MLGMNGGIYYEVDNEDMEKLPDDLLNRLEVGQMLVKKTGAEKHLYFVTYKQARHGICITYNTTGYSDTYSYDYTDGKWVFNSKDVWEAQ